MARPPRTTPEWVGHRYRLERELGQGGMATVLPRAMAMAAGAMALLPPLARILSRPSGPRRRPVCAPRSNHNQPAYSALFCAFVQHIAKQRSLTVLKMLLMQMEQLL